MKVLIIGSGAREHTILWKVLQSPAVRRVYCSPGNAGMGMMAHNLPFAATDGARLASWAAQQRIDLTIVGPESPLFAGVVDRFQALGLKVFGPTRAAALIEGSKAWAKDLMKKYGLPCADYRTFTAEQVSQAKAFVLGQPCPIVVKADGEAFGKGTIVAQTHEEALEALTGFMEEKTLGAAGEKVVIEEHLTGPEVSLLAFTDGRTIAPMVPACDYKRVFDHDQGPNTGGMGSYSPPSFLDDAGVEHITNTILRPTVEAMAAEGRPYRGVLYAGLMMTPEGPKVLEFNARLGDPETQVIFPRLKTDLVEVCLAVVEGRLEEIRVEWSPEAACGVVLASGGYPGEFAKGFPISGLDNLDEGILAFHAGTALQGHRLVTAGGRVLTLAALGPTLAQVRAKVYANAPKVQFQGCHYRTDIALREVGRPPASWHRG